MICTEYVVRDRFLPLEMEVLVSGVLSIRPHTVNKHLEQVVQKLASQIASKVGGTTEVGLLTAAKPLIRFNGVALR